jgi:hypothetical protein
MSTAADYDTNFYDEIEDGSRRSAAAVVPHVRRLLPQVKSIVEFGCGAGLWLAEFQRSGVRTIRGLDFGSGVADRLAIAPEKYHSANLGVPISVDAHDLCISIEVAEHLAADCAETFIDNLVQSAPRVLFAAASPNQGGDDHVNERPPEYWISKFRRRGYECLDILRPIVWDDDRICWWYKQNMLFFFSRRLKDEIESLSHLPNFQANYLIHPDCFQQLNSQLMDAAGAPSPQFAGCIGDCLERRNIRRLKESTFWKLTAPAHWLSKGARNIDRFPGRP